MPSRRQLVHGIGLVVLGVGSGCTGRETASGTVAHKRVSVGVPQTTGGPVDVTLAAVTYEPERQVVTGEYADIVPATFDDAVLTVSDAIRDRLRDRFVHVHYYTNVVPDDGATPINGRLNRDAFNSLSVGGTATVTPEMKQVATDTSVGWVRVISANREHPPQSVRVSQYDWDERANRDQE